MNNLYYLGTPGLEASSGETAWTFSSLHMKYQHSEGYDKRYFSRMALSYLS